MTAQRESWLVGGGEMGKLLRSMDWSRNPLGPLETWPQSLRTVVGLCLSSNFPISIAWGKAHTQIYNDGYWPICGAKHPSSMGQDFRECWASPWPVIGAAYEQALTGRTAFLEAQRMFLDRFGFLEETCFTFSFSPIRDESGGVGGLFHPVLEVTSLMLSERRTLSLRDLGERTQRAADVGEAFGLAADFLTNANLDLPFLLFYRVDDAAQRAELVARTGIAPGTRASPATIDLSRDAAGDWPLRAVYLTNRARQLDDLESRFGQLEAGPYPEAPNTALILPLTLPGQEKPAVLLVAGVSSRLPLTPTYRAHFDLVAATITAAAAKARTSEADRKRAEALAALDKAKTAFFSNVSHEFRTPLTLMLAPLEDAVAGRVGLEGEALALVHRNGLRLLKLVNSLLDFARIEAGRTQASFEPVDLALLTSDLASSFRSVVEKAGMKLVVKTPAISEPIYLDRDMWEKVVLNLLSNAFKFTFEGEIKVSLVERSSDVELSVADTGIGIPAAELPRVFERFHRVEGARGRTHEGTGIGLALVQELVKLHKGTVAVDSVHGRGTTFTVTLPKGSGHLPPDRLRAARTLESTSVRADAFVAEALRTLPDAVESPARRESGPATDRSPVLSHLKATDASKPPRTARILLADDNADMRGYVRRLLEAEGYHVEATPDGEAALAAARGRPPQLVLSDVMMPRLDGFGLLRELRRDPALKSAPVILLSARAGEESRVEGLDAGADDYLVKPFSARELLARVRAHLSLAAMRNELARHLLVEADLKESVRLRDEFLNVASHELKTPLTPLLLQLQSIDRRLHKDDGPVVGPWVADKVGKAVRQVAHLERLVGDLLDVTRLSERRVVLEPRPFDLGELAREVVDRTRPLAESAGSEVTVEAESDVRGTWDRLRLDQVLTNLLGNALRYGRGQPVVVGVRARGERVELSVRDQGIGIAPGDQERIFERFERAVSGDSYGGLGLGLWICRQIVDAMGGVIAVESAPGAGSTFRVDLPREAVIPKASA